MFEQHLLKGQVAVVTGGGTGIGLAIATRLGSLGARIAIASRDSGHLEEGTAALGESGIDALAIQLDVRKPEQVDEMVERTVKHFGGLDILVNNAAGNFICRAEDLSPNGWNAVIGIVLNGTFYCSRAVGRYMIGRKHGGSIVSILANYVCTGSPGTIHSAAAKQLWSTPDAIERITEMVPLRRWGTPGEIADAVTFLVAPQSGFITGEVLTVDGGARLGNGTFGFTPSKVL